MNLKLTFKKKMILSILPAVIIVFTIFAFRSYNSSRKSLETNYKREVQVLAEFYATKIRNEFNIYLEKQNAYNDIITDFQMMDANSRRSFYNNLTKELLVDNESILSYWVDFDKNAFDGKDEQYKGVNPFTATGRFNIAYQRGTGEIKAELENPAELTESLLDEDYYKLPRETKHTVMLEPYYYSYTGNEKDNILMTSIVKPVFNAEKQVIGVTGIDISLDNFVDTVNKLVPYEVGHVALMSQSGLYLANQNKRVLGKSILENPALSKESAEIIHNKILEGTKFDIDIVNSAGIREWRFLVPIELGESASTVTVMVTIPHELVVSHANEQLNGAIILLLISLILITVLILVIASKLSSPLKKLSSEFNKFLKGELSALDLKSINSSDETGDLANSVRLVSEILTNLINDIGNLANSVSEGNLKVRGDIQKYEGAYRALIKRVNKMLENIANPFETTSKYLTNISQGNIPKLVDENQYQGSFKEIMQNLNICTAAISLLVAETNNLLNEAVEGRLNARADASKHKGDYSKIIVGMNNVIDTFVKPLKVAGEFIQAVADGADNINKVTDDYKGDFNKIKNAINNTHTSLVNFGMGIEKINSAILAGDLSVRADMSLFKGEWTAMISGVNSIVETFADLMKESSTALNIMATGDLTPRITKKYAGSFESMKQDINNVGDSLTDLILQLKTAIETTAAASAQISANAENIAAATQEQSSQTDEVANSIEIMSRTVANNAQNAARTADVAKQSGIQANEGGQIVKQTVTKMREIATVVKTSAADISKLGESSKKIGEIISVIDDIADQTNLLSLNAAIEAARAGEQGRGFAVVADSVGKLAISTASATKEIAEMIKGIQNETTTAVYAMEKGTVEVQNGIELADKAGASLEEILSDINQLLEMVNQIAVASDEQSATSEQISQNVSSISKVTADSAQNIEDVASTANELARMTETLNTLISQFKVDNYQRNSRFIE